MVIINSEGKYDDNYYLIDAMTMGMQKFLSIYIIEHNGMRVMVDVGETLKVRKILKKLGLEKVAKRSGRETSQGLVHAYIHNGEKVGALVKLLCETDFVAKSDDFKNVKKAINKINFVRVN